MLDPLEKSHLSSSGNLTAPRPGLLSGHTMGFDSVLQGSLHGIQITLLHPLMCDQEAGPVPQASPLPDRRAPWDVRQEAAGSLGGQHLACGTQHQAALHSTEWNPRHTSILLESGCRTPCPQSHG